MSNNLEETYNPITPKVRATCTQVSQIIASLPVNVQENMHLSITGLSHRVPYGRLPHERKAKSRLLANTSSLMLHDVPIWTSRSGSTLINIESCAATQPVSSLQLPFSIQMKMEVLSPGYHGGDDKGCTDFLVDMCYPMHALTDADVPICIVFVTVKDNTYHVVFVTAVGSLLLYVIPVGSRALSSKVVLGYNVTMCAMLKSILYFLSNGRLYSIELNSVRVIPPEQLCTPLQPQPQIQPHLVPHGAKVLTHISTDCTEVHAMSSTGTIYSGTCSGLVRVCSLEGTNIVSFVAISGKKVAYITLRSNMIAYLCTSHGDILATYNAVLQIQQTVDKQGALLLLRGLIILVYGDTAYSIVISPTADSVLLDAFSSRLLSSNIMGNTLTIMYSCGDKCFRLIARFPPSPKSQLKRASLQNCISMQSIEVKQIGITAQVPSDSFFFILTAHNSSFCCIYFSALCEQPTQIHKIEVEHCIFGNRCVEPSLCSLCRCRYSRNTELSVNFNPLSTNLNWYINVLTEAGKVLDYDRAVQIVKKGMDCDEIKTELINQYATSSLAPFLNSVMLDLAQLKVLTQTGCSFVALHVAILIVQRYGASTPWLTALVCQDTKMSRKHLRDLVSIFSLHLGFFGIPVLGNPMRRNVAFDSF
ncbi:Hypothetical protein GLP15_3191 [Giardia lamblia P15]|uniref:Uncharacterized protein n=1 Tax=Giardia intestinalis (strain P15) TaxID=658858 RepID=E1F971_GIAIA|nr:Hypothetical protein GLP15_3191 [Giardia lamblia P15]